MQGAGGRKKRPPQEGESGGFIEGFLGGVTGPQQPPVKNSSSNHQLLGPLPSDTRPAAPTRLSPSGEGGRDRLILMGGRDASSPFAFHSSLSLGVWHRPLANDHLSQPHSAKAPRQHHLLGPQWREGRHQSSGHWQDTMDQSFHCSTTSKEQNLCT